MNEEYKRVKGRVSNTIAWILLILQIMLFMGGLYAGGDKEAIAFFSNLEATVQSLVFITAFNILGIGALLLSLIVWRYHKNNKGKLTAIIAVAIIIFNTFCNCTLVG